MKKIEPSKKNPIRSYIPELEKKNSTISVGMKYKPGFIEQYKEIMKFILNKKTNNILCNIDDAIKVLYLIELIIKKAKK